MDLKIGIDIDGVLANFWKGYEELHIEIAGADLFGDHKWPHMEPQCWDWPETFGYTKDHTKEVWRRISKSPLFWTALDPLPEFYPFRDWITDNDKDEIYFITNRLGTYPKLQTEVWFGKHQIPYATVLISEEKGLCCAALDLELYIDDKQENIDDVERDSPETNAFLLTRPYNRLATPIKRTTTLMEVLEFGA